MQTEKIINYDSPEAAQPYTMSGWKSSDGRFWKDEHSARYAGCTHLKCSKCENLTKKGWTVCEECRHKNAINRYMALPFKEWDYKTPLVLFGDDQYFFDESDIEEYLADHEDLEPEDLQLVICTPNNYFEVTEEHWSDILPENSEGEVHKKLREALDALNKVIETLPPASWSEGKFRTSYAPLPSLK
jgi:hypothetical protein